MSSKDKSLAHLADKFNIAPPPNYVAGRGRGASGFSKPSEDPPKRGGGASAAAAAASTASAAASDGRLEGDAADTRELDLSETERFEEAELSMDNSEAGAMMEPFNMSSERREGSFDDDFNFVWKRKGEDPDDVQDAWLGEVDAEGESAEKVEKRRKLLQRQMDAQQQPDEQPPDTPALLTQVASLLQTGESVASALRRLSGGAQRRGGSGGGGKRRRDDPSSSGPPGTDGDDLEEVRQRQQFDVHAHIHTHIHTHVMDTYVHAYTHRCFGGSSSTS